MVRDLLVITPTRGRLASAIRLADAIRQTCELDTQLVLGIDDDDRSYDDCFDADWWVDRGPRQTYAAWTNQLARRYIGDFRFVASLSDDHLPETKGWDVQLIETIEKAGGTGIAYGNDLLAGGNLPTAPVMSRDIVRALGWMCQPDLTHLFCDNVWLDIGAQAGCLFYMKDVIIRHLHYTAGLSPRDQTAIDGEGEWAHDEAAYHHWRAGHMAGDVAKVKGLADAVRESAPG